MESVNFVDLWITPVSRLYLQACVEKSISKPLVTSVDKNCLSF